MVAPDSDEQGHGQGHEQGQEQGHEQGQENQKGLVAERFDKAQTDLENTKKMKDAIQAELDASKKMVSRMRETNFDDMAEASIQIHA